MSEYFKVFNTVFYIPVVVCSYKQIAILSFLAYFFRVILVYISWYLFSNYILASVQAKVQLRREDQDHW